MAKLGAQQDAGREAPDSRIERFRRLLRQLGAQRVAVAAVLLVVALLAAGLSWNIPLLHDAEDGLYDVRASLFAPATDTD